MRITEILICNEFILQLYPLCRTLSDTIATDQVPRCLPSGGDPRCLYRFLVAQEEAAAVAVQVIEPGQADGPWSNV